MKTLTSEQTNKRDEFRTYTLTQTHEIQVSEHHRVASISKTT